MDSINKYHTDILNFLDGALTAEEMVKDMWVDKFGRYISEEYPFADLNTFFRGGLRATWHMFYSLPHPIKLLYREEFMRVFAMYIFFWKRQFRPYGRCK